MYSLINTDVYQNNNKMESGFLPTSGQILRSHIIRNIDLVLQ